MKAVWNGVTLAESEETVVVDTFVYFPADTVHRDCLRESEKHTDCPWKGLASYYHVVVGGEVNEDAAWYYPETKEAARHFEGHVAFWRGVEVVE